MTAGVAAALGIALAAIWAAGRLRMAVRTRNAFTRNRDLPSPLTGRPAPDLALVSTDGTPLHLAHWRGRPVILTFWSSF